MEVEVMTTRTEKIRDFVKDNAGIIIGSGLCLMAGGLLGCKFGYRRGAKIGRDGILTKILYNSDKPNGLIMVNPDFGRYAFTAEKLAE